MKLEHAECEAKGCQYNVTAGKLAQAEREVERLQLKVVDYKQAALSQKGCADKLEAEVERLQREWTGMKSEIQLCHPKIERLEAEVERLRTLNEVLRNEHMPNITIMDLERWYGQTKNRK